MLNTIDLPKKAVNSPIYADSYDRTMVSNCRLIKIQISVLDVCVGNLHIPIGGSQADSWSTVGTQGRWQMAI